MLIIDEERYFLEKETATKFGLSLSWFRRARYEDDGPPYCKLNGRVFYNEKTVTEWFKNNLKSSDGTR